MKKLRPRGHAGSEETRVCWTCRSRLLPKLFPISTGFPQRVKARKSGLFPAWRNGEDQLLWLIPPPGIPGWVQLSSTPSVQSLGLAPYPRPVSGPTFFTWSDPAAGRVFDQGAILDSPRRPQSKALLLSGLSGLPDTTGSRPFRVPGAGLRGSLL